jgi:hypothetical protein
VPDEITLGVPDIRETSEISDEVGYDVCSR